MKKWIGFALCVMLVLTAPAVQGATVYTEGYFEYQVRDGGIVICGYFGRDSVVTVPASIAGYPVSAIGVGAFSSNGRVDKINLPDTIMTIEEGAIGGTQTVVYNSNTDDETVRQPDPVPTQTTTGGATTGGATTNGSAGTPDGDRYEPQAPEMTQQPASPTPTASPVPSASPEASQTAAPTATPAASQEPEAAESPVTTAAPEEERGEDAPGDATAAGEEDAASAQDPAAEPQPEAGQQPDAEVVPQPATEAAGAQDEPDQLTIRPLDENNERSGWFWLVSAAAAGCAAVLAVILILRKKYGK